MGWADAGDDCNEDGVSLRRVACGDADRCDIVAKINEDTNENGVPDECEGELMMMGALRETGDQETGEQEMMARTRCGGEG